MSDHQDPAPRVRYLSASEIDSYDVLPHDLAQRVRLVRVPFLFGPYAGMSLGRNVLIRHSVPDDGLNQLLAHELVHVRQWAELGVVGFLFRYLRDFARGLVARRNWQEAYLQIEAEREARELTRAWHQRRNPSQH